MRDRHAAALARFLMGFGDDEAGRFIDHLADLVACLNADAEAFRQPGPWCDC
jgi:hypothetical protein